MKIYIIKQKVDDCYQNILICSSRKIADHIIKMFVSDNYEIEEHDLIGESIIESN